MHVQGGKQPLCVMFQATPVFKIKLKLQPVQVMANTFIHFYMLAKRSPVNSDKHAAVLSI